MSKFNWRNGFTSGLIVGTLLAVFFSVWVGRLNYCPDQPCGYTQANSYPDQNTGDSVWSMPSPIRGTFSYKAEPSYSEGNPQRHEYYDLRAQERMAHATDWIAWLTAVTGLFSIFGLGAILYTLNLQRASNQIMRDEQRPWLHIEIDEITEYLVQFHDMDRKDFATGIYFNVPFKIRNTGTSSAHNVSVSIAAHNFEGAYRDVEHFKSGEAPIFINQRGSLAPNTTISDEEGVTRKLNVAHEGPTDGFFCFLVAIVSYSTSQQSELPGARTIQNFRLISDIEGKRTPTVSFEKTKAKKGTFVASGMGGGTMT